LPPTFIDLKTRARDWLAVDTGRIADAVLGDCINLAIRDLAREHDLWLNEKTGNIALVEGGADVPAPADFSRPLLFSYTKPSSGKRVYLKQKTIEQLTILFPELGATTHGDPQFYAQFGSFFEVMPPPAYDVTTILNYYAIPADLTDPSETNLFTQYAWEAVFFRALVYATRYLIEDPRKDLWRELAQEHELRLVIEHARARHSGGALVIEEPG
jgi:hypothetical protein